MLYLCIAILAGCSIVIARVINANLATKIGIFQGTFYNFITGLAFSFLFLVFSNEAFNMSHKALQSVPVFAYLGGLLGVIVIGLSNYIIPKISSFYLTLLIFIGQLSTGIIIDFFYTHEISIGKVVGCLFVFMGLTYNLIIDRTDIPVQDKKEAY